MRMKTAAFYLRSSKDRAEVGTDSQRAELTAFAEREGLSVVKEFADMEVSGSLDEVSRPGFRHLVACVQSRQVDVVLAVDTSRIARDPAVGMYFSRECEKAGVQLRYSKVGIDTESAVGEMVLGVLRQFDRLHARLSADKGRAGQEANLSNGWRAGGRAPLGYTLQREPTGASRAGAAVYKSKLALDPEAAPKVAVFLKARAIGVSRTAAARQAGLSISTGSLVGIENNALTYSGALVWNRSRKHRASRDDPRQTMIPRPREEWIIVEGQHPSIVTRDEAERVLAQVQTRPKAGRVSKPEASLLTGLLVTPTGAAWHYEGARACYRVDKGRRVKAEWLDQQVLFKIAHDSANAEFVTSVVNAANRQAAELTVDPQAIERHLTKARGKLARLVDALADGGNFAILRSRIKELEDQVAQLEKDRGACAQMAGLKRSLTGVTPEWVRFWLSLEAFGLPAMSAANRTKVRSRIETMLASIVLDPESMELTVNYRFTGAAPAKDAGVKMASPRGLQPSPQFIFCRSSPKVVLLHRQPPVPSVAGARRHLPHH